MLNPNAPEFVPASTRALVGDGGAAGNGPTATIAKIAQASGDDHLTRLPGDVLQVILSFLPSPRDVAFLSCTSKRLATAASAAPLRLQLPAAVAPHEAAQVADALAAVAAAYKGTQELDLSGCAVEESQLVAAAAALPELRCLQLSGCRKLSAGVLAALRAGAPHSKLEAVSLQRCFQLTATSLFDALEPHTHLRTVLLSHLQLPDWPAPSGSRPPSRPVPRGSATPSTAPGDESGAGSDSGDAGGDAGHGGAASYDGGSSDGGDSSGAASTASAYAMAAAAAARAQFLVAPAPLVPGGVCNLRVLALHNCAGLTSRTLRGLAAACPRLRLLLLGGTTLRCEEADVGAWPLAQELWEAAGGLCVEYAREPEALALAATALELPQLQAIEATFIWPRVTPALAALLQLPAAVRTRPSSRPVVWDFTQEGTLQQALALLRSHRGGDEAAAARLAVRAAANCSSMTRHTPLHMAATKGIASATQALLECGAGLEPRDRGGNTPLFLACELGQQQVARLLMAAGASLTARNNTGEAPLYIAALRGHGECVAAILTYLQRHGICWHSPELYSEGWSPLLAATVGGHGGVVRQLLRAACSEGRAPEELVAAANRGGQTALHVAAQTGRVELLRLLLEAGGEQALALRDNNGRTAVQIAYRSGNRLAADLLAAYMAATNSGGRTADGSTVASGIAKKQRRRRPFPSSSPRAQRCHHA